ncbi:pyocin knob domain-containing protein [Neisseria polysaccharea]|uniref:pyocin knob domain-containing protein n=1 Tax=Neisseria polysaccharea TaxID=489 RepID=UPI00272CE01D|nr:pyocin knob domain-containing protein [Neisseria polysaccharea]
MANLNETAQWEPGIYQLETSDPVMGGPDGIDNRQAKQLANRTLWLKNQTEALQTESEGKVSLTGDQTVNGQKTFTAATQFQNGIHLSANQTHWNGGHKAYIGADNDNAHIVFGDDTLRLHGANNRISYNNHNIFHAANKPRFSEDIEGKPNTLSGYGIGNFKVETFRGDLNTLKTDGIYSLPTAVGSSNLPVENTACHIQVIAGTQPGWCRQLGYPAYTSDVYERHQTSSANDDWSAWKKLNSDGIPVGAIVSFPKAVRNPAGYLRADGTTFAQNTFPDLYRALGNSNRLPDLSRTDIGITAWFPSDQIPTGWLAFDEIADRVTESAYPELYRLLVAKYGSIRNVPQAEDRFIRNAANGLAVGTKQGDAIRNITGKIDSGNRSNEQLFDTAIPEGAFGIDKARKNWTYDGDGSGNDRPSAITFDASRVVPTADENRPKALVLKLCIKAADTLGEAVFWIKSHGETVNAGALDAGTLAQGLQEKADRAHTHTAAQIQGLDEKISAAVGGIFGNSAAATGWQKLPGGILIQWGKNNINGVHRSNTVYFPVSFGEVWSISTATHTPNSSFYGNMAAGVTIRNYSENNLVIDYHSCYETAGGSGVSVSWIAIGKAGTGNAASPPTVPGIDEETLRGINEDALNEIRSLAARGFR